MSDLTAEELADLDNWSRPRLQKLCKKVGIKANLKNVELIESLRLHYSAVPQSASTCDNVEHSEEQEVQQASPKRRRTLSPARDEDSNEEAGSPERKAKKKKKYKTAVATKRLVKRRKSRRPSLRRRSLRSLIRKMVPQEGEQEEEEEQPVPVEPTKDTSEELMFDDLCPEQEEQTAEPSKPTQADKPEVTEEKEEEEGQQVQQATTEPEDQETQANATPPPKPAKTPVKESATVKSSLRASPAIKSTRKRKSGEMGTSNTKEEKSKLVKKVKGMTPAIKMALRKPPAPKLTKATLLRQQAIQRAKEQKQKELEQAAAKILPNSTPTTTTTTTIVKKRVATPLPPPTRAQRKTPTPIVKELPKPKPAPKVATTGGGATGLPKARPLPNFEAIHNRHFDTFKSIDPVSPSVSSNPSSKEAPSSSSSATSRLLQSSGKVLTTASRKRKLEEAAEKEATKTPVATKGRLTRTTSEYGLKQAEKTKTALPAKILPLPSKKKPLSTTATTPAKATKATTAEAKDLSKRKTLIAKAINNENERNKGNTSIVHK